MRKARLILASASPRRAALLRQLGIDFDVVPAVGLDAAVLGKPANRDAALLMLTALSGRAHRVFSAVAISTVERHSQRFCITRVHFREISAAECCAYWATGEPRDKAGAYAIQGMAAVFITALHGSYSGVMGLPLFETGELMQDFGIEIP